MSLYLLSDDLGVSIGVTYVFKFNKKYKKKILNENIIFWPKF